MLTSSGRRHPCPVCGRQKNSSCRWGERVVYCFCGNTHHPPLEMRPGETLAINGKTWALVSTAGGHSGNSFVFRPHIGAPRPPRAAAPRNEQIGKATALMQSVLAEVDAALSVPEFIHQLPDELRSTWALIDAAAQGCSALKPLIAEEARLNPALRGHLDLLADATKQISYQQQDALNFRTHYLGEPMP